MKKLFIATIIICTSTSCSNYYKAITTNGPISPSTITEQQRQHKYFILRDSTASFAMENITLTEDGKKIRCTLDTIPDVHTVHLTNGLNGKMDYKKTYPENGKEAAVLNEVHLYTNTNMAYGNFSMPLSAVEKTEMIEKDLRKTNNRRIKTALISIGITAVAAAVIYYAIVVTALSAF